MRIRHEYATVKQGERVTPVARKPLDWLELKVLRSVRDGADVHSDQVAKVCRGLALLGLVHITDPAQPDAPGPYGEGPWFGCIATGYGRRVLAAHSSRKRTEAGDA